MNYIKQKYIKSFSKGQITIPKEMRDSFGLGDIFWLKLYTENGKIVAEPVEGVNRGGDYLERLLKIKGNWIDEKEMEENRNDLKKRLLKND